MIIPCIRCGEPLVSPNKHNAYYVIGEDTVEYEDREVLLALIDTRTEEQKEAIPPEDLPDDDAAFEIEDVTDRTEVVEDKLGKKDIQLVPEGTARLVSRIQSLPVQKTGIVCANCVDLENDELLWGAGENNL